MHTFAAPGGPLGTGGFRAVNDFARDTGWLHGTLSHYATFGGLVLLAILVAIGYLKARASGEVPRVASALWVAAGAAIAFALNQIVVDGADESRPFVTLHHVLVLTPHAADPGFPSDHAVVAGAVAAGMFFVWRVLGWISTAAAILLAFARVYVGVHYPDDVLAGLALGAVVVLLGMFLLRPLIVTVLAVLTRTPLALAVAPARLRRRDAVSEAPR